MNKDLQAADVAPLRAAAFPAVVPEPEDRPLVGEEQLAYAGTLDRAMKIGLLLITATFVVYVAELLPPHVALEELPRYWSMSAKEHLAATGGHAGWAWLAMVHKGDFLNFVGIAFLAGTTIFCYAKMIPVLIRKKERAFVWISVAEVAVLTLAASGLLRAGGH